MTDWKTSISSSGEDAVVRGVDLEDVADLEFSDAIWLVLRGGKPGEEESEMFGTVLSICVDHGVGNPSTVASRTVQSGGNPLNASVAAGILALGDSHGGAIEGAMEMLQGSKSAEEIVEERLDQGEKIPGLGHKVYDEEDPRAEKILDKAEELGLDGEAVKKMQEVKSALAQQKVSLPVNVDGAIAAVMTDLGWEPELGKGLFIVARTPGLVAHVREEMDEEDFRREEGEYTAE